MNFTFDRAVAVAINEVCAFLQEKHPIFTLDLTNVCLTNS